MLDSGPVWSCRYQGHAAGAGVNVGDEVAVTLLVVVAVPDTVAVEVMLAVVVTVAVTVGVPLDVIVGVAVSGGPTYTLSM